jgi:DNA-binding protein H-NS
MSNKLSNALLMLVALLMFAIAFWLSESKEPKPKDEKANIERAIQRAQAKFDSLQDIIRVKDSIDLIDKHNEDSLQTNYEKAKSKPKPDYLRTAAVNELDSFWQSYKANW